MKKVRYSGNLQKYNSEILRFGSPYGVSWHIAALEMQSRGLGGAHVLEFGCGEGHASRVLLEQTNITMDLVDIEPKMVRAAKEKLSEFDHRISLFACDVHDYLRGAASGEGHQVIFSSFVMHNFPREERRMLLKECRNAMKPGGTFILNDSIPPRYGDNKLLAMQLHRYRFLPDGVREQIIAHVKEDATAPYYMPEAQITHDLAEAGFSYIKLIDRVDREALIFADA